MWGSTAQSMVRPQGCAPWRPASRPAPAVDLEVVDAAQVQLPVHGVLWRKHRLGQAQPPVKKSAQLTGARLEAWAGAGVAPSHTAPLLPGARGGSSSDLEETLSLHSLRRSFSAMLQRREALAASTDHAQAPDLRAALPPRLGQWCPPWPQKRGHLLFAACPITACSRGPALSSSQDSL